MKTFIQTATDAETRKASADARSMGNIVARVDGGIMIFDNAAEYKTWRKQR